MLASLRNKSSLASKSKDAGESTKRLRDREKADVQRVDAVSKALLMLGYWKSKFFRRRLLTVTVQDDVARIVTFSGNKVTGWGTAYFQKDGDLEENDSLKPDENLGPEVRGLFKEFKESRMRQVTSLPIRTALLRRLTLPPFSKKYLKQVMLTELSQVVPFSEDQIDIVWQTRKQANEQDVFAAVAPKRAIDQYMRFLKQVGARPHSAFSRTVALACAADLPNALVVHLGERLAEIVLVDNHVPEVSHVVEFSEDQTAEDQAAAITEAITHITGFFDTKASTRARRERPLVVVGSEARRAALEGLLEKKLDSEPQVFQPPFDYPAQFPVADYAVNLGLALADRSAAMTEYYLPATRTPSLDIMPQRHAPRTFPILQVAMFVPLILFVYVAFGVAGNVGQIKSDAAVLSAEIQDLERDERRLRIAASSAQAAGTEAQLSATQALALQTFATNQELLREALGDRVTQTMQYAQTAQVTIANLSVLDSGFSLSGAGGSFGMVAQFARLLRESGLFSDIKVTRVEVVGLPGALGAGTSSGGLATVRFSIDATPVDIIAEDAKAASKTAVNSR
ncbi:MAG: PilN domain-containing protein [Chloroflexi bacterium]|nr:PilN domain-containing protein [Chloroflexota bacterium]